jgi:alkanesulfonate monooxygenase SsuD/methylene tetrahydromethanopterin reductase-like flavin-dependent oxidoreductase (luciferase family)
MGFHLGTALFMPDRDFTRNSIKLYRDTLVKHGHDRSMREVCGITQMFCAKDQETAVDKGARFANNYYRFFSELPERAGRKSEPNNFYATADAREMNKEDLVFLGTPENLVERINRAGEDLGMDLLLLEVAQGGAAPQDVEETLELFGREVLPHVQSRQPVVKVGAAG